MSADNWTYCPRCTRLRAEALAAEKAQVDAAYGTVTVAEFDTLRTRLERRQAGPVDQTWREDYEIGLDGDEFYVIYHGSCAVCGLKHEVKQAEILDPQAGEQRG